jgi:hypothetical protein
MSLLSFLGLVKTDVKKVATEVETAFKIEEQKIVQVFENIVDETKAKIQSEIAKHQEVVDYYNKLKAEAEDIINDRLKALEAYGAALAKIVEGEPAAPVAVDVPVAIPAATVDQIVAAQAAEFTGPAASTASATPAVEAAAQVAQ